MVSLQNKTEFHHSQNLQKDSLRLKNSSKLADVTNKRSQLVKDTSSSSFDLMNVKKYRFRCPDCPYQTNHVGTFNRHKLVHNKKFYSCDKCPYKTYRWEIFQTHKQEHGQPGFYSCHRCDFKSKFMTSLRNHTCDSSPCAKFPFKTNTKVSSKNHIKNNHTLSDSNSQKSSLQENDIFTCTECNFRTKVKGSLKLHQLTHAHLLLACTHCDFTTTVKKMLTIHERSHLQHNFDLGKDALSESSYRLRKPISNGEAKFTNKNMETSPTTRKKMFNCPLCGFSSSSDSHFKKHLATHDNDCGKQVSPDSTVKKNYACSLCSFNTSSLVGWNRHTLRMHVKGKISKGKTSTKDKISTTKSRTKCKFRKNMKWSVKDKKEIYWCHIYAKHKVFERIGIAERRRDMLLKRGILDPKKIHDAPDSHFQSITANLKVRRTEVAAREMEEIEESVEQFMKKNKFINSQTSSRIVPPLKPEQ